MVVSSGPGTVPEPGLPAPWLTQDIGTVGLAGTASFQAGTGTYSVTGAGADIWGTADAFRFVYQPLVRRRTDRGARRVGPEHQRVGQGGGDDPHRSHARIGAGDDDGDAGEREQFPAPARRRGRVREHRRRVGHGAVLGQADASRHEQSPRISQPTASSWTLVGTATVALPTHGTGRAGGVEPLDHDARDGHLRSRSWSTSHNGGLSFALARSAASKEGHG